MAANQTKFAEMLIKHASSLSLQVSQACYHEVLHGYAVAGEFKAAWRVMEDMRVAGFTPNQVSCSILLKMISSQSQATNLSKIIDLLDSLEEPADDVLMCSITEACLRVGRLDLLPHMTAHRRSEEHTSELQSP